MSDSPADLGMRLYGMMQYLMAAYAQQVTPEVPEPRGVVQSQDALDAIIQLAAVIDEATQAGRVDRERGKHAATMLMVIRDYIQPLPRGLATDGVTDNVTPDLQEIVTALRQARQDSGLAG
ncbi:MAG TPA: hypothetical protein VHZ33_24435 [Trebonia sp.]|nr:hypothetical protein [Trebonia sp.]